jgi:predicted ATP-binding protein involved in virulence
MDETFLTALDISHVRHLKDIHISLSQEKRKTLILTGKNGSGKTSVLDALEKFLEYAVSRDFQTKESCQDRVKRYQERSARSGGTDSERLEAEQSKPALSMWEDRLSHWDDGVQGTFTSYADLREKYKKGTYILAYYRDNREIKVQTSKNIEKVDLKSVYAPVDRPSQQLVKYLVNLKTTQAFAQTSGNLQRVREIADWFDRFEQVLRSIYDDPSLQLHFDIETFQFSICVHEREPFDFNSMSRGYAAVFDIIGDLIMRMESQRRYDLEGLVLIDEIETHLHVELQKKIMPILMELFPNIQFILTSHSPFILNSTPNAVVYDLEKKTLVEDGLTNLPYEGIVEGYFGADLLSPLQQHKKPSGV